MADDQTQDLVERLARAMCALDDIDPDALVSFGVPRQIAPNVIVQSETTWWPAWMRHARVASDLIMAGWRPTDGGDAA